MNFKQIILKTGNTLKEKAPEILVVAGIASLGVGIVLACKATLSIDKQKDEIKAEVDKAVNAAKDKFEEIDEGVESEALKNYGEEEAAKDKAIVYGRTANSMIKTGFKVAKVYAPAAGFIVLGLTCILFSHKILRDRNATLLAAYTALDSAFKAYRARVIKDGGKTLDAKYLYGTKTEMKEVKRTNPETGQEETVIETEEVIDYPLGSPYARIYDKAHSTCYQNADPGNAWNESYLEQLQEQANLKLQRNGYVYLNDVYEMLGLTKSPAGQHVGWVKDNPNGDGYIDFGIKLTYEDPRFKDFIEPGQFRRKLVLDFNVDGPIDRLVQWNLKGKNDLSDDELAELEDQKRKAIKARRGFDDPATCAKYDELEDEYFARANK